MIKPSKLVVYKLFMNDENFYLMVILSDNLARFHHVNALSLSLLFIFLIFFLWFCFKIFYYVIKRMFGFNCHLLLSTLSLSFFFFLHDQRWIITIRIKNIYFFLNFRSIDLVLNMMVKERSPSQPSSGPFSISHSKIYIYLACYMQLFVMDAVVAWWVTVSGNWDGP